MELFSLVILMESHKKDENYLTFFPPTSAVEVIKMVPIYLSVNVSVCLLVSILPTELFDIRTQNLVEVMTLRISLKSLHDSVT